MPDVGSDGRTINTIRLDGLVPHTMSPAVRAATLGFSIGFHQIVRLCPRYPNSSRHYLL
jgi:hypothetical protein